MRRLLVLVLFVVTALSSAGAARSRAPAEGVPAPNVIEITTATLELILPKGATAAVDGKELGTASTYTVENMKPKQVQRLKVNIHFLDDKKTQKLVDIIPGQNIRMPVSDPDAIRGETYVAGNASEILAIALSRDGRYLATTSSGRAVVLWDLKMGRVIRTFPGHTDRVNAVALSRDGKLMVTGSSDLTAILWDVASGEKLQTFKGHFGEVWGVDISPDSRFVLTGAADKTAILWNADTGAQIRTFEGHRADVSSVSFSPKGSQIVTGSFDNNVIVWNPETGKKQFTLNGHRDWVMTVTFNRDGDKILTGSNDNTSILWNADTGKKIFATKAHENDVYGVAISPGEFFTATADRDQLVGIWDGKTGKNFRTLSGHQNEVTSAAFSADNRLLFTGSRDSTVKIWDTATGEEIADLVSGDDDKSWAVTIPDGHFDGTEGGRAMVSFRYAERQPATTLEQLFNGFYSPGLLAEIWEGKREQPSELLRMVKAPKLKLVAPQSRLSSTPEAAVVVAAEEQGLGIGPLTVYQNGLMVHVSPEEQKVDEHHSTFKFKLPLVSGDNQIRVTAKDVVEKFESRPVETNISFKGQIDAKSQLYVLAIGITKTADPRKTQLKYPAPNVGEIVELFKKHGGDLYDQVHVTTLIDPENGLFSVYSTVSKMADQTKPQDTFIVYYSGWGDDPYDLELGPSKMGKATEETFQHISVDDLIGAMGNCQARRRVFLLESVVHFDTRSDLALRSTLERVAHDFGVYAIGTISPDEKLASRLGHGVLTYALMAALKEVTNGPLEETFLETAAPKNNVEITDLFNFVCAQVPQILEEIPDARAIVERSSQTTRFPILTTKTK